MNQVRVGYGSRYKLDAFVEELNKKKARVKSIYYDVTKKDKKLIQRLSLDETKLGNNTVHVVEVVEDGTKGYYYVG